jgi:hypothetical protein
MALVRKHSQGAPLLPALATDARFEESLFRDLAVASDPTRSKSRLLRRPQCPGNRSALARVFDFPRQFTLENCQLPPALPQSSFGKF